MSDSGGRQIKAIETRFLGYRFRSRTEARWAVFLNHLGVTFEYEKEGFTLPDGARYLPDFYLTELDAWIEVKGCYPDDFEIDLLKMFHESIGTGVYCLWGNVWHPTPNSSGIIDFCAPAGQGMQFAECCICGSISIAHHGWAGHFSCSCVPMDASIIDRDDFKTIRHGLFLHPPSKRINAAFVAAREARFEHGEKPTARTARAPRKPRHR